MCNCFFVLDWINSKQLQFSKGAKYTHFSFKLKIQIFALQAPWFYKGKYHLALYYHHNRSQCRDPVDSKSTNLNIKHFQHGGQRVFKHFGIQKLLCQHIYGRSTTFATTVTIWYSLTMQESCFFSHIFSHSSSHSHLHTHPKF